jgi:hypothetical protein
MTAVQWLQEALSIHLTFEQQMQFEGLFQQAKEMEKQQQDEFAIGFAKWITSEKSEYSILYGNQEKRFATFEKDYTSKELLEIYKKESKL